MLRKKEERWFFVWGVVVCVWVPQNGWAQANPYPVSVRIVCRSMREVMIRLSVCVYYEKDTCMMRRARNCLSALSPACCLYVFVVPRGKKRG